MTEESTDPVVRLARVKPFDQLPDSARQELAASLRTIHAEPGETIFAGGSELPGIFVIQAGAVEVFSVEGDPVTERGPGEIMGERGVLRDGRALLSARAKRPTDLILIPSDAFRELTLSVPAVGAWFEHALPREAAADEGPYAAGLMAVQVSDIMARDPVTCIATDATEDIARIMRDRSISSVLVVDSGGLEGIVTVHDLVNKVLAEGLGGDVKVGRIMTSGPVTVAPDATGLDALLAMAERGINHLPVSDRSGRILGMIGRTDLFRQQAATASHMAADIVAAESAEEMAAVMARLPQLLLHLVAAGTRPESLCRRITDLTDAATRRLLALAEAKLGRPPVPYLWAACGSQGRREQTGVSDQDNCLILDDAIQPDHGPYFEALARFVCDGLNRVGFVYCPGDMMATNPRWRQPRRVWRSYFANWIAQPDEEAQMLASVMFDLRPISGEFELFDGLQKETLRMAKANSIFVHHMTANALGHRPPLTILRGLAVIRSGEHRNRLDLKHSGVVPVVDLGRLYALKGGIPEIGTRDRILAAADAGILSQDGARDLSDAYELIREVRLAHQARQIADGEAPGNFLDPSELSDLERNHLRDAFLIVRMMQASVGSSH